MFSPGDPVPHFHARSASNPQYAFGSTAGRYIVLTFIGSTRIPGAEAFYRQAREDTRFLDDAFASMFIVSNDPRDAGEGCWQERYPGLRLFHDDDGALLKMFGHVEVNDGRIERVSLMTWILDPGLRVIKGIPVQDLASHFGVICEELACLPSPVGDTSGWAPVLLVPRVFEPEFCGELIAYAERKGLEDSGYMNTDPATGNTVMVVDHNHKRRSDCLIEDEELRDRLQARIHRRLVPQIQRAFQFHVTRMERYLVSCYDADIGGHFRPHKDNTTLGTAHRRFAVSINLNAEDYEGGDLRFPEFGHRTYRPPTGGAIVFSCSLLHEAMPITRGRRFVVLPFLYDEAAAAVRLENAKYLQDQQLRKDVIASVTARPRSRDDASD